MKLALHAVQVALDDDYIADEGTLRRGLDAAAVAAVDACPDPGVRLIVYPAHVGTVVALGMAPPVARRASTLGAALAASLASRPWTAVRAMFEHATVDPRRTALAALAPRARAWSFAYFAALAKRYQAFVVAGSGPRLLRAGRPVNSSMVFSPEGKLLSVVDQVNLLPGLDDSRALALSRGEGREPVHTETPFGSLVTLVGYDAQAQPLSSAERFAFLTEGLGGRSPLILASPLALPTAAADDLIVGLDAALEGVTGVAVRACVAGRLFDQTFAGRSTIVRTSGGRATILAEADSDESAQVLTAVVPASPAN